MKKLMARLNNLTYYQKLLLTLSIFIFIFVIPYSIGLYHFSQQKILQSIQTANEQSLTQIKSNYDTFNESMKKICFSVYLNNQTQNILYNPEISYKMSAEYINYLKKTVLNTNPSIYSIHLYNGSQERYFSTLTDSSKYLQNLVDFLEKHPSPPKLQPILRKIPHIATDSHLYTFSYILYDYSGKDGKPFSYIILEQNASWLIENFSKINQSDNYIPSRIYLLNPDGNVCSENPEEISDTDAELLNLYYAHQNSDSNKIDTRSYTEKVNNKQFLITGLTLNDAAGSIVLLQNYDDVFVSLNSFQCTFHVIILIWCILLLAAILGIAKRLYAPVKSTLSYIGTLSGTSVSPGNEFQQMMSLYKSSYENQKKHSHVSRKELLHYQLIKLLTENSALSRKTLAECAPEHWLLDKTPGYLYVLRITFHRETITGDFCHDEDFNLFLFAVQNILSELLEEKFSSEVFSTSDSSIWGIIRSDTCSISATLENIIAETKLHAQKFIPMQADVSYSRSITEPEQLHILYNEVNIQHKYHYVYGPNAIISPEMCKDNLSNTTNKIPENLKKRCIQAIKFEHEEEAIDTLKEIFVFLRQIPYEYIQICIIRLINEINYTLKEISITRRIVSPIHFDTIYHVLDTACYLKDIEAFCLQYLSDSMSTFLEKAELNKQEKFINDIQHFVEENYTDSNLSSQMLAEHLNLSAKYIMKKFQEHTGISLTDYITETRMRQAAILLMSSQLPISKISQQVGITNENYFYKLFKKKYGCTPREFSAQSQK